MVDVVAVAALLARALPYLSKSADRVATQAGDAIGDAAWRFAQRIWAKVGGRLSERPAAQEAIDEVAATPDDEGARFVLERQLGKLFEAEPELAAEVEGVMSEAVAAGVVQVSVQGDRNVTITDSPITNSAIISADGNTVGSD
ncbi:MAG: hypothetical protein M3401_15425 [Actinomycetota bacterium]|nr:hypothetical protein [Actinomycetota bacterium]